MVTLLFGYAFELPYHYLLILLTIALLLTPFFITFQLKWKKEEKEFYQLTDFLQQFLASFKQHPKIYASLIECRDHTEGDLYESINTWISGLEKGGFPKQYADIFIQSQSHFIISNLVHLMLAVENYGTFNYIEGLEIIQDDIEDWIEDTTLFKFEQIRTRNRIQILALFACGIAWMSHNMLFRTEMIETLNFYYFSLFVFLVLILLTLFFSQKLVSVPWIERNEKLWE
jgi:hypothetical protein